MLHVYHSNRLEALFILMCTLRESQPLTDPLTPETVLVANPGIGRWLNFQIADRSGIAANIDYKLPATFVWQLYRSCLEDVPEKSAFERNALRLRVLSQLDAICSENDEIWSPLQRYAASDGGALGDTKRVQLATRIADVFDQYLVYRPKMLLDWEQGSNQIPGNALAGSSIAGNNGESNNGAGNGRAGDDASQLWQPALWRRLVESVSEPHRASLWQQFCTLADKGDIDPALLPPQLHLFNVGLLPPSTLDVLVRVARLDQSGADRVSLYFLNPAIDYWADLLDMRRAARERLKLSSNASLTDDLADSQADDQVGNPLLGSLGGSGRTLMKLLSDRSEWVHDEQFFLPSADDNLLAAVQADLLQPFEVNEQVSVSDKETGEKADQTNADTSIQLHQCYSPMREVQALSDRLLDLLNADHSLTPADIIVMVPDINRYAPVIEAVFGSVGDETDNASKRRRIPWSIADRALVEVSRVVACVQRLFELPGFEFEATGVLAFAAEPAIARKFGFDERALSTLADWLNESGVRRTLAGDASKIFQQPDAALHSWDFGLRRLLLGRAMPPGAAAVGEVLPATLVEGQQAGLLSQLINLLNALAETRVRLDKARAVSNWVDVINEMINRFLQPDDQESDALAQFREVLTELVTDASKASPTDTMSHATFAEILRGALAGAERKNHRYLTGRVTFSSMVPLRSVPFRVVCMLGLNDSDFPRQRPNPGFDLIARHPLPGDRSVRDDDRYLFLEALLSARDELYLSWIYRNASDNASREPSVLVSELRDYLTLRHPNRPPRCVAHPLQPFSKALFNQDQTSLYTFASEWAPPADRPERASLNLSQSHAITDTPIALDDFQRFWNSPSAWYCRRVLGVALWRDEQEPQDAEPFGMDALSQYAVRSSLVASLLWQPESDKADVQKHLTQSGFMPHGGLGELVFDTIYAEAKVLAEQIREQQPEQIKFIDINVSVNEQQLQGRLTSGVRWPDGSTGVLHHHASKLHGGHISRWWLDHIIGSASGEVNGKSILVTKDKLRELPAIGISDAIEKLQPWFAGWHQGQSSALPFFPKTSAATAGAVRGDPQNVWLPGSQFGAQPESQSEPVQLLYGNPEQVLQSEDFQAWAGRLLGAEELKP